MLSYLRRSGLETTKMVRWRLVQCLVSQERYISADTLNTFVLTNPGERTNRPSMKKIMFKRAISTGVWPNFGSRIMVKIHVTVLTS